MISRSFLFVSALAVAGTLAACTPGRNLENIEHEIAKNGRYWQRTSATSATWMQGPKAQQVLNRDIARCVTELAELERLGQIKSVFPVEKTDAAKTADEAQKSLMEWDNPERDGALLAEGSQYIDFETCMKAKGWERVMYVPYDTGVRAGSNFVNNHVYLKEQKAIYEEQKQPEADPDYSGFNN